MTINEAVDKLGKYTIPELIAHCRENGIKGNGKGSTNSCLVQRLISHEAKAPNIGVCFGKYYLQSYTEDCILPHSLADLEVMYERAVGSTAHYVQEYAKTPELPADLIEV